MPTWITVAAVALAAVVLIGGCRYLYRCWRWSWRTRRAHRDDVYYDACYGNVTALWYRREAKRLEREGWRP